MNNEIKESGVPDTSYIVRVSGPTADFEKSEEFTLPSNMCHEDIHSEALEVIQDMLDIHIQEIDDQVDGYSSYSARAVWGNSDGVIMATFKCESYITGKALQGMAFDAIMEKISYDWTEAGVEY